MSEANAAAAAALAAAIAALESQRALLGDAAVDAALAPLRARWAQLTADAGPASFSSAAPPLAAGSRPAACPPQALRLVTVLFMDIVGSTSLTQKLDPEEVHDIMDGALQRFTVLVQKRGGRVLQYAGDNLLAAFGAEAAREDDAEQAIRAGLDIIALARDEAAAVARAHGHQGFDVRVGVHTGSVLLGGGVDAEGSIRGMTVNVAARMEQTAPAGSLRISRDTWRHVRGLFVLTEQPAIQVKGRDEPIVTYLVHGSAAKAFRPQTRGIEGLRPPMVGRETAVAALMAAWQDVRPASVAASALSTSSPTAASSAASANAASSATGDGRARLVNIVGDAGVGKSRLLEEFDRTRAEQAVDVYLWRARAQPAMQAQPYGLLRECLVTALGIADTASPQQAQALWQAALQHHLPAPQALAGIHLLGHLLGLGFGDSPFVRELIDDERQRRQRAFATALALVEAMAAAALPLWLLEDLHWADGPSLEFMREWLKKGRGLCLATLRESLFEVHTGWPRQGPQTQSLHLQALDAAAAAKLAQHLLAPLHPAPEALHDLLVKRGQGNPFYMEEIVKMLIDDGAIVVSETGWQLLPQRLVSTRVPSTLTGVLQARLDSLPPAERAALQDASVLGLVFWDAALQALDDVAPQSLPALDRRALLHPHPTAVVEHRPSTAVDASLPSTLALEPLHPAAVREPPQSTPAAERLQSAALAERPQAAPAAHRLQPSTATAQPQADTEATAPARAHAFAYELLHQVTYDTVLKRVRRDLHQKAAHWLAGLTTARAADYLAMAAEHFEQAAMPSEAAEHRLRAAEHALQRYAQDIALDQAAHCLRLAAPEAHDVRWRALLVQQRAQRLRGLKAAAAQSLEAMAALAQAAGRDDWRAVQALRQGVLILNGGDAAAGLLLCQQALVLALATAQARTTDAAAIAVAGALRVLGRHEEALAQVAQGLVHAQAHGHRRAQAELLSVQAGIHAEAGDALLATQGFEASLAELRACGDVNAQCATLVNLGDCALRLADAPAALRWLAAALDMMELTGLQHLRAGTLCNLSAAVLLSGDVEQALATAGQAQAAAAAASEDLTAAYAQMATAHALAAAQAWAAAAAAYRQSAEALEALHLPHLALEPRAGLAWAAASAGDVALALAQIQTLWQHAGTEPHFKGSEQPLRLRWQMLQALRLLGDERAATWGAASATALRAAAASLPTGPLRERFLTATEWARGLAEG